MKVAVVSVISNAAKSSLRACFEGVNWPLNKALPKGAEFLNGPLGDIMRQFCLVKRQVARQLLNYNRGCIDKKIKEKNFQNYNLKWGIYKYEHAE